MGRFGLLILICIIIWGFWMTWEWLRNKSEPIETDLEKEIKLKQKEQDEESI